jgi:hypothetical protein
MYIAIIGDLIKSKEIKSRAEVQSKLRLTLDNVNRTFASSIASDFTITLGDEFQGVLNHGTAILEMIDRIKFEMKPVEIRFGIGLGDIVTEIDRNQSLGADGPAYWNAREAILNVEENNDYDTSKVYIVGIKETQWLNVVNESLRMCDYLESKWRESQAEFMHLMIKNYGYDIDIKQKNISLNFNMSSQMVNKKIQNTGYYHYVRLKRAIGSMIESEMGGGND